MFLASLVLRQPPAELRALRFPETFSIPRAPGVSHPRGLERARVRTPGLGSNSAPLPSLGFSQWTLEAREPQPQPPTRCPSGLRLSPGALGIDWAPVSSLHRAPLPQLPPAMAALGPEPPPLDPYPPRGSTGRPPRCP